MITMDKLLKLFEKYNCHLKRGYKTSAEFLRENFDSYLMDVKASLAPEDNPLYGAEMCTMVSEQLEIIKKTSDQLIEVLVLYSEGKIVPASVKAFEVFNMIDLQYKCNTKKE